jgi:hypothetical protein
MLSPASNRRSLDHQVRLAASAITLLAALFLSLVGAL